MKIRYYLHTDLRSKFMSLINLRLIKKTHFSVNVIILVNMAKSKNS